MDAGIVLGGVDRGAQGGGDLRGDRVAAVGIVDRDEGDAVLDLHQYEIGHASRVVTGRDVVAGGYGPRATCVGSGVSRFVVDDEARGIPCE
jgi:hypothetical protein